MPSAPRPPATLAHLAALAGCSVSTVSRALRGSALLPAPTIARIRRLARQTGYRANPLLSVVMQQMRRRQGAAARGNLAYLMAYPPGADWRSHGTYRAFLAGAEERAAALGFHLDVIVRRDEALRGRRLTAMLEARHHVGLLIGPWQGKPLGPDDLDWSRFAAVKIGVPLPDVPLPRVGHHAMASLLTALELGAQRGYHRPGLALQPHQDRGRDRGWTAALRLYQGDRPQEPAVPMFGAEQWNRAAFGRWFRRHRPDLVCSLRQEVVDWLRQLGARVPETTGFIHLDWATEQTSAAGIDQRSHDLGRLGVDLLHSLLLERAAAELNPRHLLLEGHWVEGTTLRNAPTGAEGPMRKTRAIGVGTTA